MLELVGWVWSHIFLLPLMNGMIIIDRVLFGSFGLAILVFTIISRVLTWPLQLRQIRASQKMQALQPKLSELQKKYKDPRRRSEEQMKLYKEQGVNPAGCVFPFLIQFPIWIAVYDVVRSALGSTPESAIGLSQRLYPWSFIQDAVPLSTHFLWMDLGRPDFFLPIVVGVTMYLQQKMTMVIPPANAQQAQTNQMLLYFMPLMFAWITLSVPSGLGLYWAVTNIIGVIMNYFVYGWRERGWRAILRSVPAAAPAAAPRAAPRPAVATQKARKKDTDDDDGRTRGDGKKRR